MVSPSPIATSAGALRNCDTRGHPRMMPAMSGGAFAQMQAPAKIWVSRRRDGADASTESDPVLQRMLDLQRDAGNAAVAELVGQKGGAAEAVPEDPAAVAQAKGDLRAGGRLLRPGPVSGRPTTSSRARTSSALARASCSRGRRPSVASADGARRRSSSTRSTSTWATRKRAAEATLYIEELKTPESTGDLEVGHGGRQGRLRLRAPRRTSGATSATPTTSSPRPTS